MYGIPLKLSHKEASFLRLLCSGNKGFLLKFYLPEMPCHDAAVLGAKMHDKRKLINSLLCRSLPRICLLLFFRILSCFLNFVWFLNYNQWEGLAVVALCCHSETSILTPIYFFYFFETEIRCCYPGCSAMARSRLITTSTFWVQAILLPQPPE